jgi:hypothetical protein
MERGRGAAVPVDLVAGAALAGAALAGAALAGAALAGAAEPTGKHWLDMDYGPFLSATIEAPAASHRRNFAYKGLAVRLAGDRTSAAGSKADAAVLFDTDLLRYAAGWTGGFLELQNIAFDGSHGTHVRVAGDVAYTNPQAPGWADPRSGSFADPRALPYGPLPRAWAHWKGLYLHEDKVVLSYTVGDARVRELPAYEELAGGRSFVRHLEIEGARAPLVLQVLESGERGARRISRAGEATESDEPSDSIVVVEASTGAMAVLVAAATAPHGARWKLEGPNLRLALAPPPDRVWRLTLLVWRGAAGDVPKLLAALDRPDRAVRDLTPLLGGGPPRWREKLTTRGKLGGGAGPFAVDDLGAPMENPWRSWMRLSGFDFLPGGRRAAVCTWMGDVWTVDGLGGDLEELTWQRIATGLFQPLGLAVRDGAIHVLGRDQITVLRDLDGDGEADFYECFNNDAQVTEHFHEFAMDLQVDAAGDFHYARAARHALGAVVPHHGAIIRVARDGSRSEVLANGFRAPNGLCLNTDGTFITSDQEGHWTPANRINWVKPGSYHGYAWSYLAGEKPESYAPPLCWLHRDFDRSPAAQVWVESASWGPLRGKLLSLSYGTGQIAHVLFEKVGEIVQGGAVRLDIPAFPTGIIRGRFHTGEGGDGHLYVCGLFGWSSNRTYPGGFYRVRSTGKPLHLPLELHATERGIVLAFSEPLDAERSSVPQRYAIERWNYRRTAEYGSKDYRVSDGAIGRDRLEIKEVKLSRDGRSVLLEVEDLRPCMQMLTRYRIAAAGGARIAQEIYHTIHVLGPFAPFTERFE